jgi:hypothetical protein
MLTVIRINRLSDVHPLQFSKTLFPGQVSKAHIQNPLRTMRGVISDFVFAVIGLQQCTDHGLQLREKLRWKHTLRP